MSKNYLGISEGGKLLTPKQIEKLLKEYQHALRIGATMAEYLSFHRNHPNKYRIEFPCGRGRCKTD